MTARLMRRSAPDVQQLVKRVAATARRVSQTANLMCGVPDYDTYVRHRQEQHPNEPYMTREEFFRNRQSARYPDGSGRGMRCC